MNKTKIIIYIIVFILGALFFIYGGQDDSPGAQLIGAVLALAGIIGIIRNIKRKPTALS